MKKHLPVRGPDEGQFSTKRARKEDDIPEGFICPITHQVMRDPVKDPFGHTYERDALVLWVQQFSRSPFTNVAYDLPLQLEPNAELLAQIRAWKGDVDDSTVELSDQESTSIRDVLSSVASELTTFVVGSVDNFLAGNAREITISRILVGVQMPSEKTWRPEAEPVVYKALAHYAVARFLDDAAATLFATAKLNLDSVIRQSIADERLVAVALDRCKDQVRQTLQGQAFRFDVLITDLVQNLSLLS